MRFFLKKDVDYYYCIIKLKDDVEIDNLTLENLKSNMTDDLYTIYSGDKVRKLVPNADELPIGIHKIEVTEKLEKFYIRRKILIEMNNAFNIAFSNLNEMGLLKEINDLELRYYNHDLVIHGEWDDGYKDDII